MKNEGEGISIPLVGSAICRTRAALQRILHSSFVRNVALVALGTAGAKAITMAFSPLIARIFGPEVFGQFGIFTAIVAVVAPVAALAYPIAIVLPRDDGDALQLVHLSFIVAFVISLLIAILIIYGGDGLAAMLGAKTIAKYLILVPASMFFAAWVQITHQWLIRKKEFTVISHTAIVSSLIINVAKSGFGWIYPVNTILIAITVIGGSLHAALLFFGARKRCHIKRLSIYKKNNVSLKELAYLHRDFPLYRAPQNVINALSQSLPIIILATLFGPTIAGFYALAQMVMGMPSNLIGKAVSDVFYPRITHAADVGENIQHHIIKVTVTLLGIGLVPFGLVIFFGPEIFSIVFGADWAAAGEYARWLAFFFLFNFINKPAVAVVPVIGAQRGLLLYELFSAGLKVFGLYVGFYFFGSAIMAVALFSIFGVLSYVVMILWIIFESERWSVHAKTG